MPPPSSDSDSDSWGDWTPAPKSNALENPAPKRMPVKPKSKNPESDDESWGDWTADRAIANAKEKPAPKKMPAPPRIQEWRQRLLGQVDC